jgi:hypothetical protein
MSLLIALVGRRKVVICADSRAVWGPAGSGNEGDIANDCVQKLFQRGTHSICGMGGMALSDRLTEICSRTHLQDAPRQLLEAVRDDLSWPFTDWFKRSPFPSDPIVFSAFALQRKPSGELDLLELEFPTSVTASGERFLDQPNIKTHLESTILPGRFAYSHAHGDCLTKKLEQKLNPDTCSDSAILSGIDEIFEAARNENAECYHEIGGPIDVALIDSAGFQWLRKKPESLTPPANHR